MNTFLQGSKRIFSNGLKLLSLYNWERIVGLLLLLPPLLSVFLFILDLFCGPINDIVTMQNLSKNWTARISWEYTGTNTGAGAGATSATPIYLGLMAIAGSILLKKGSEK